MELHIYQQKVGKQVGEKMIIHNLLLHIVIRKPKEDNRTYEAQVSVDSAPPGTPPPLIAALPLDVVLDRTRRREPRVGGWINCWAHSGPPVMPILTCLLAI